jgi:putative transposase
MTDRKRRTYDHRVKAQIIATGNQHLFPELQIPCCPEICHRAILVRKPGRPRKANESRELVLRIAAENPGWGYTETRDALRGLKIELGRTTVANIFSEAGIEPAPERNRKRTWKQFLRSHWETLYACDFFGVEMLGIFGAVRYMVFFVIELKSRAVYVAGIRIDSDGARMMQVARNLFDPVDGFLRNATHLIHDRDPLYTKGS